jgi:hypothetical protein
MANLAFIRSATCFECWDYYEKKTDVWVFGNVDGYDWFRQNLVKATRATKNIHLTLLEQHPTSMRSVILPAKTDDSPRPRLKFIERFVSSQGSPNMELVIFGNEAGYLYLADKIAKLANENVGSPSEHVHLDDLSDPHVVPRSVSLNLRGPIQKWEAKHFGEYSDLVHSKSQDFLPTALNYRLREDDEYEEITAEESEFLKL